MLKAKSYPFMVIIQNLDSSFIKNRQGQQEKTHHLSTVDVISAKTGEETNNSTDQKDKTIQKVFH